MGWRAADRGSRAAFDQRVRQQQEEQATGRANDAHVDADGLGRSTERENLRELRASIRDAELFGGEYMSCLSKRIQFFPLIFILR
jgi:hypothetical protein